MVTLDKCLNRYSEVKKKLSKIDAKDPSEKPALKAVEAEVKIIKVNLNNHKHEVRNFDSELKSFEQETKKLFETDTSLLAGKLPGEGWTTDGGRGVASQAA